MSVAPRLFCFIAFSGVSQRWEFKNTTKQCFAACWGRAPGVVVLSHFVYIETEIIKENAKKLGFFDFFYHVFGRFSVRGVQKHDKKPPKIKLTSPGTFLASEEPTSHVGVRRFVFECPL
jgi:hypothetical protein